MHGRSTEANANVHGEPHHSVDASKLISEIVRLHLMRFDLLSWDSSASDVAALSRDIGPVDALPPRRRNE